MRVSVGKAIPAAALFMVVALNCAAQPGDLPVNGFNDPFFQISDVITDCPVPLGPRQTHRQRLVQSHHRAERGTTCWLRGECATPNAYAQDHELAQALLLRWRTNPLREQTSLWMTVQAKVVYLEGCSRQPQAAAVLEAFARSTPGVVQALAMLREEGQKRAPYVTWKDAVASARRSQ